METQPGDRLYHFHGGLRLRHHKKVACESPIEPLPLPDRLYVPLKQHQGPAFMAWSWPCFSATVLPPSHR